MVNFKSIIFNNISMQTIVNDLDSFFGQTVKELNCCT